MGYLSGECDDPELNILVIKEPYYNIMMVSTFSVLTVMEGQKEKKIMVNIDVVKFRYPEVVSCHYKYKGEVENHNALRNNGGIKSQISLDTV